MKFTVWAKFLLPLYLFIVDLTSLSATEQTKSYGNQLRRVRIQREKLNPDKSKREIVQKERNVQRKERQAVAPTSNPSYDFAFRTPEYQRRESSDVLGRVRGLYSFVDDVGETHLVRYAASADRGFEVLNSVPDASRYVQYSAPLYKTSSKARGRIAIERGPGRQYKFISAGPDQRRSESTGPDGVTRGAFSYLDDKGIQRSTQYIAGAGIGYRVVQATTGPGTHLLPRPAVVEFGILYPRQPASPGTDTTRDNDVPNDNDNRSGTNGVGGPTDGFGIDGMDDGDSNSIDSNPPFGNPDNRPDFDDNTRKDSQPGSGKNDLDFPKRDRGEGTIIFNSGDTFFGIPPGASARAHVQNIDLKPFAGAGAISPSEALKRDEYRSLLLKFRG